MKNEECSVRDLNPMLFWFCFMTGFLSLHDDVAHDASMVLIAGRSSKQDSLPPFGVGK